MQKIKITFTTYVSTLVLEKSWRDIEFSNEFDV